MASSGPPWATRGSKATATRDLTPMVSAGQLRSLGAGKAVRYCINMPEWTHRVT